MRLRRGVGHPPDPLWVNAVPSLFLPGFQTGSPIFPLIYPNQRRKWGVLYPARLGHMDEFNAYLRELGWSRAALGRRLGLNKNTISHWKVPPGYALAYLRMAVDVKRVLA